MRTRCALVFAALAAVFCPAVARAQGSASVGGGSEPPLLAPDATEDSATSSAWARGAVRPFVSSVVDIGWLYARPRIAIGYGRPHWLWVGAETATSVSASYLAQYAGLRASLLYFEARVGARYTFSFNHWPLPVQDAYNRFDIDVVNAPGNRYITLEAEISGTVPIPSGAIYGVATVFGFTSPFVDNEIFEESLHVIVRGSSLWRGRLGYLLALGATGRVRIGPAAEVLVVPGRDNAVFVRAGLVASLVLTTTLEIVASFMPTVYGPDHLGLVDGDFADLGFRWRWATGLAPGYHSLLGRSP